MNEWVHEVLIWGPAGRTWQVSKHHHECREWLCLSWCQKQGLEWAQHTSSPKAADELRRFYSAQLQLLRDLGASPLYGAGTPLGHHHFLSRWRLSPFKVNNLKCRLKLEYENMQYRAHLPVPPALMCTEIQPHRTLVLSSHILHGQLFTSTANTQQIFPFRETETVWKAEKTIWQK